MNWEAFWERVERRAPSECWPWRGKSFFAGYGCHSGKFAHRLALEFVLGRPIAADMQALHSCDHKWCVSPAHLSEDTARENHLQRWDRITPRRIYARGQGEGGHNYHGVWVRELAGEFLSDRWTQRIDRQPETRRVLWTLPALQGRAASESHECEGHEERMRGHEERIASSGTAGSRRPHAIEDRATRLLANDVEERKVDPWEVRVDIANAARVERRRAALMRHSHVRVKTA